MKEKRVKRREVHKYLLSGLQVEDDCGVIAGAFPIILFTESAGSSMASSAAWSVRRRRTLQRLTNAVMSWLGEMAGRFDIEKPIFDAKQMVGNREMGTGQRREVPVPARQRAEGRRRQRHSR